MYRNGISHSPDVDSLWISQIHDLDLDLDLVRNCPRAPLLRKDSSNHALKLGFCAERHSPASKSGLVDINDLKSMLTVFPNLSPPALIEVVDIWLDNLIGGTQCDEYPAAISQPSGRTVFPKPSIGLSNAREVFP